MGGVGDSLAVDIDAHGAGAEPAHGLDHETTATADVEGVAAAQMAPEAQRPDARPA